MSQYSNRARSEYATKTDWRRTNTRRANSGRRESLSPSEWQAALESANAKSTRKSVEASELVRFENGQLIFELAA